jgi:hypothetical protein
VGLTRRGRCAAALACVLAALALLFPSAAWAQQDPAQDPAIGTSQQQETESAPAPSITSQAANAVCNAATNLPVIGSVPGAGIACPLIAAGVDVATGDASVGDLVDSALSSAASSAFGRASQYIWQAASDMLLDVMTWWINVPLPDLYEGGGADGLISKVNQITLPFQLAFAVASVFVVAMRLAVARKRAAAEESAEGMKSLGRIAFTASILPGLVIAGDQAATKSAQWILDTAGGEATLFGRIGMLVGNAGASWSVGLLMFFGLLLLGSAFVMAFFMIVRNALLIIACATLPIAAAASGFGTGRQAYQKLLSWVLAFLLYKPVGALVIALGLWAGSSNDDMGMITGFMLLIMSIFTLPALIKLMAPVTAQLGGGSFAGAIAGGAAAAGSVPSMMKALGGMGGGGTSGPGGKPAPPTGAANVTSGRGPEPGPGPRGGGMPHRPGPSNATAGGPGAPGSKSSAARPGAGAPMGARAGGAGAGAVGAAAAGALLAEGARQAGRAAASFEGHVNGAVDRSGQ